MTRNPLRLIALVVLVPLCLTVQAAPKKKRKHRGSPPPAASDSGMTFEPETVERRPEPARAPPPAAEPSRPGTSPSAPLAPAPARPGRPKSMEFAPAPPPVGAEKAPSKSLERALKLYDSEDYYPATIELNRVVEGQSKDDEAGKQRAEFFMGKALFNLKFYSASLNYFDRIVQKGPNHRYHQKTLQWLASLSRFLPESAGVLEKIGKYSRQDLDQPALEPVRNELYYLLGRYNYGRGSFKDAISLFEAVPEKSDFFAKAKFFEGITHVREGRGREASDSFKAILRKVKSYDDPDKVPKALREFEELANVSLGRVFYSTKQFQQSIKYYEKLPQEAPDWLPSLFEASWAYFQIDGDSKALGNIHTVNAPFFENEFYPESFILKAVIYFNRCNYDRSYEAIREFNTTYPDLKKDLDQVLAKYPDNAEFYTYVVKVKNGEAGLSDRVQRAAAGALADRTLQKNIDYVVELDRELKAVDRADAAWKSSAVAATILQDLTLQKSLAAAEAGGLARQRLKRLANEIQDLVKQAIKIEFETLNAQKGALTAGLAGEQSTINPNAKNYNHIQIDDEHQYWPFNGEYWKDELGFYRFKVQNRCGK